MWHLPSATSFSYGPRQPCTKICVSWKQIIFASPWVKSKFQGILHFPLEKVKNLHFSPRKVKILGYFAFSPGKSKKPQLFLQKSQNSGGKLKILGEKSKYRRKSKIPRKKQNSSWNSDQMNCLKEQMFKWLLDGVSVQAFLPFPSKSVS